MPTCRRGRKGGNNGCSERKVQSTLLNSGCRLRETGTAVPPLCSIPNTLSVCSLRGTDFPGDVGAIRWCESTIMLDVQATKHGIGMDGCKPMLRQKSMKNTFAKGPCQHSRCISTSNSTRLIFLQATAKEMASATAKSHL